MRKWQRIWRKVRFPVRGKLGESFYWYFLGCHCLSSSHCESEISAGSAQQDEVCVYMNIVSNSPKKLSLVPCITFLTGNILKDSLGHLAGSVSKSSDFSSHDPLVLGSSPRLDSLLSWRSACLSPSAFSRAHTLSLYFYFFLSLSLS